MSRTLFERHATELKDALQAGGHAAKVCPNEPLSNYDDHDRPYLVVNVWAEPTDRYPAHSIYIDDDGYTWGGSFEFKAAPEADIADLAARVIETLPAARR